ncbi:hypothetical protein BC835DRAFT_718514 [Cytidiella melzeri]|nr:hypothetical protein BC835DRAFT_718514 [Cytidiella melzeri]
MSMKRKLSIDFDDEVAYSFPTSDTDVAMSDASSDTDLLTPLDMPDYSLQFHSRLNSTASTTSSASYTSSPQNPQNHSLSCYPDLVVYPSVDQSAANFSPKQVGLMQPKGTSFTHHGQNCSQIPKLRMACAAGLNGQRTMWAHCEQCGAIEMVDTD